MKHLILILFYCLLWHQSYCQSPALTTYMADEFNNSFNTSIWNREDWRNLYTCPPPNNNCNPTYCPGFAAYRPGFPDSYDSNVEYIHETTGIGGDGGQISL